MASDETKKPTVVIVGAGFAGVACAKELAKHDIPVTLIDRHNYQQFQPLLYQVATAELGTTDVARPIRAIFAKAPTVKMRQLEVTKIDPETKTVTTGDGQTFTGDYLIVAAGAQAELLRHARRREALTTAVLGARREEAAHPSLRTVRGSCGPAGAIDKGALNFVIVGAGPTGVETAGALADLVNQVMPKRHHSLQVDRARIYLVDHGQVVLRAFSDKAHEYAAGKLQHNGVQLMLGLGVNEVAEDRVVLSDGSEILTRCVVWGGGIQASTVARQLLAPVGRGGTLTAQPDLSAEGHPNVFVIGDIAAIPTTTATRCPSSGRSRCRAASGPQRTSSSTSTASPGSPSATRTRGSWR